MCVWCYLHTAYYKWIFFLYSKWGVGRNISNNSSHTALFHPRRERGVSKTLLNWKKSVNATEIFSLHQRNCKCTTSSASDHREELNLPNRSVLQIKLRYGGKTLEWWGITRRKTQLTVPLPAELSTAIVWVLSFPAFHELWLTCFYGVGKMTAANTNIITNSFCLREKPWPHVQALSPAYLLFNTYPENW